MKKLFSMLGILSVSALTLVGCSAAEEEPRLVEPTAQNDIKNFEQNGTSVDPVTGEVIAEGNAIVSTGNKGDKEEMRLVNIALKNSAQFFELNKDKSGYSNENEYSLGMGSSVRVLLVRESSSAQSYCLLATSFKDETINVFYDSQIKNIVPEGQSCKEPIGEHWEPRNNPSNE